MSVLRQTNWLGQARIDLPILRMTESSVAGDFDLLAGQMMAGNRALVLQGFGLQTTGAIGSAATALRLNVAGGTLLHPLASDSGSIFSAPAGRTTEQLSSTNPRVQGSFTAGATNFIGIDLLRSADSTTTDLVMFLDADSLVEKPRDVPLARTMDYVISISTADFSTTPGLAPIAKVVTDAQNNVVSLTDARQMMWRLGSGGSSPDVRHAYTWPAGRKENTSGDVFSGGDKTIGNLKDWADAIMTRIWDGGGGEYWYGPTADRNCQMVRTGTAFSNGEYFEWDGTHLHWRGLSFLFENSTANINEVADQTSNSVGLTDLGNGDCIYVDLDRTQNRTNGGANPLTAIKTTYATLGSPSIPGSRYIIAWRSGANIYTRNAYFAVGTAFSFAVATNLVMGVVQLTYAAGNPANPKVAPQDSNGKIANTATGGNTPGLEGVGHGSGSGVHGIGGAADGPGVLGEGTGVGSGLYGRGLGTGSAITAQQVSGNKTPLFFALDANANQRWIVDWMGYPTSFFNSNLSHIREDWIMGPGTVASWDGSDHTITDKFYISAGLATTGNISTSSTINFVNGANGPSLLGTLSNTANQNWLVSSKSKIVTVTADLSLVAEWEFCCDHTLGSASGVGLSAFCGFSASQTSFAGGADEGMFFFITDAAANWQARTVDHGGTATTTDTVNFDGTASQPQKMRIEVHGANTAEGGGTTKIMFYMGRNGNGGGIDMQLVATHTTHLPTFILYFVLGMTSGGGAPGFVPSYYVGPVDIWFNRYP